MVPVIHMVPGLHWQPLQELLGFLREKNGLSGMENGEVDWFKLIWSNYNISPSPRFPWNFRGFPLLFTTIWGPRSCEVAIIWPEVDGKLPFFPYSWFSAKGELSNSSYLLILPKCPIEPWLCFELMVNSCPHLPLPFIFGTRGRSLPDILATGSLFQIYRELEDGPGWIISGTPLED